MANRRTQYIVLISGSLHNGYTSHIEKVILPNDAEHGSTMSTTNDQVAAIKAQLDAQLDAQLKKYLHEHKEKVQVQVRFIVTVDGSSHNGYTATIEKVKPKIIKEVVIKLVKEARITAQRAQEKVFEWYQLLATNEDLMIKNNTRQVCTNAINAADVAVIAADNAENAIKNAEETINSKMKIMIQKTEVILESIVQYAKNMSITVKATIERASAKEGDIVDPSLIKRAKDAVIPAKGARNLWEEIDDRITSISSGGYRKYRSHTYRSHKQRKHNTIRKS
jgi:hypothetical protein